MVNNQSNFRMLDTTVQIYLPNRMVLISIIKLLNLKESLKGDNQFWDMFGGSFFTIVSLGLFVI